MLYYWTKELMLHIVKETSSDEKASCSKSFRDKRLIILPKPPAIKASGISTKFSPENPDELCDSMNFFILLP